MVLTYGEWIARTAAGKLDGREMEMLRCVQENGLRLQALLSALRQYIYISESGDAAWTSVDSAAAVRTALSNLSGKIEDCRAVVECGPLPVIDSVEILLVQLFQNLIGNAVKYRSAEPLRIEISAQPIGSAWRFTVADNGIGIEQQYLEYIFGVFKRLHGPQYSGTGIGLAICKSAVERLGGTIWVESTLGKGSAFHFELPRRSR